MGCSIPPILFITAFEVILIGARQVVGGARLPTGRKLPPLRSYMDDITCLLQTAPCTSRLMKRLDELITWARMKFKARKSRSLSLRKGVRNDRVTFTIGGEDIPVIADQPIRSLGRHYTASLSDKEIGKTTLQQLSEGLAKIDASQLPGKFKVWCFNFTLHPRIMWPLKLCEVTSSAVSKMDAKASSFIRKWLGLPRCHSSASLYGKNILQLPLKSITVGYRQEKARLVMELRDSSDETVRDMKARVVTGRKWKAQEEVQKAVGRLQHQEVVGKVQTGRAGLGWGDLPKMWSRANRRERKDLVITEVTKMAEEEYRWLGVEQACDLCGTISASLQHTLSGCRTALSQGRYRWRHDQVLRKLAEVVEKRRQEARNGSHLGTQLWTQFLREGEARESVSRRPAPSLLSLGVEWRMEVDLGRQLHFPGEICDTTLRPDMVLWTKEEKAVLLVELTVPWEEGMEGAYERKRAKYTDLAAECRENGWRTRLFPVEVGTRGFVGVSTTRLLKELGLRGKELHKATKELAEEAEKETNDEDLFDDLYCGAEEETPSMSKTDRAGKTKETHLERLLKDLGLEHLYQEKLTLSKILQIDEKTISDEPPQCNSDLPWYFLKKLMMVNVTARNVQLTSACESVSDPESYEAQFDLDKLLGSLPSDNKLNPLDVITALFLCSDGFVQQELALKMSMCQFAVPLLLPNCDTNQCTLMLWAMRDIVKEYRPSSLSESKGFIEDRLVVSDLLMVSFVRLGECSWSKTEILNKLLSNSQQYHDTFVHRNMEGGDCPRQISNGLTEISWYLPCGNKNMDVFSEPVAVANLRGDITCFETQFSFLCQTSAAVFVFFDDLDSECKLLTNQNHKAQIFFVGNQKSGRLRVDALKEVAKKMNLSNSQILLRTKQMNDADFTKILHKAVNNVVENSKMKMKIEQMVDIAHELGIWVDEDCEEPDCKENADAITAEITDIPKYKETKLPLQGETWKELTRLEKEEFQLRKVGSQNIEMYKSDLQKKKAKLRNEQNSYDVSNPMTRFISAISTPSTERCYFLKWMRLNLDNLSRQKLSDLREAYKNQKKSPENKEEIKKIDQQLSNSSLGIEHFFREMGQIYEASVSLPETDPSRQQFKHLPKLCAELLLDGLPVELVDGDASNIPLRWVTDVLSELNKLVSPRNKILVVTVLGVQSTGKSTLLNTMFGVQFAVSSGRCTRGAFMLLIKVNEDMKKELGCDFLMIIDTEGLKSPGLSKLDNSYEHDNELATLVVGLSDITIINIAMENSTEMKDILQIVVHAFLRMKAVGKKPKCQFVHQNVAGVSAPEKNLRERELLLEQLNEMTQAAARMEKKEEYKNFTDVMEYNPDTGNMYIPGLWNGSPPMAPVNAGYSEAVYELKKNILQVLGNHEASANNIPKFTEWITSLWRAVKHENFIFSFRNSLVADAYMKLCTEYNKWEWEFKKEMYFWTNTAETKISNFGRVRSEVSDIGQLLKKLKTEASSELFKWETKLLKNLEEYLKKTEGHVYLVEPYREDFANSAKSLRRDMESSVFNQLTAATDVRRGMKEVEKIKMNHTKELGGRVHALIEECRKKKVDMTDKKLDEEFDTMWDKMVNEQTFPKQETIDVMGSVLHHLMENLRQKGSHAMELLNQKRLQDCGKITFKYSAKGFLNQTKPRVLNVLSFEDQVKALQKLADCIITDCSQFVKEKVERKNNYHDTFIQEILHMMDEKLEKSQDLEIPSDFEVSLKQHICANAAREFQRLHKDFIQKNDPYRCLCQNKEKFRANFKDEFHERDQCQKKAKEFTDDCLKPAVVKFVSKSLGPDIIDDMTRRIKFSTRVFFEYSVLLDLIRKDNFEDYLSYVSPYEQYVKKWIFDEMLELLTNESVSKFEDKHLRSSIQSINDAVNKAQAKEGGNLQKLIQDIRQELVESLVISEDSLGPFMILNNVDPKQFAQWLTECVKDMAEDLRKEFKNTNIRTKLTSVDVKPQIELYKKLVGCGKQCPFCKAPCEAGAAEHKEHFTTFHRPKGLGRYICVTNKKLTTDICTSSVISATFCCVATNDKWHPYKEYKEIFPDWLIAPDTSLKASDYWKYVLTKFNNEFAEKYKAEPAEIPDTWKKITKQQAKESLEKLFDVK
ncbi:LOW QUALITY PROTEIN: interferon-induced very large GTPase 1-like [Halichoeres trimaculatus]|uniref:LOW QUALITY PROTEIN: interferon-induced very large GTPase 1-like n=1 Tax=Halichoeres trimaculatus TaxID=147232 RepID=UPI003D9E5BE1